MTDPYSQMPPHSPGEPPPMADYASAQSYSTYGTSGYRQRPGIITSIGVISIVVGSLSALGSLMGGCMMLEVTMVSKMSRLSNRSATVYPTPVAPVVAPTTSPTSGSTTYNTSSTVTVTSFTTFSSSTTNPSASGGTALTPAEVQGAISRAQRVVNGKLNASQVAALNNALSDPNQTIIAPGTAWSPVRMGNMDMNGGATLFFTGEVVTLDAQGQMASNPTGLPKFQISDAALACTGLDVALSMALAIFLFVAGIMALRQSPTSRRLHLIYALLKIPLAIGGAVAIGYLVYGFYAGIAAGAPGGAAIPSKGIAIVWAAIIGVVAIIYPLSLLIAMNTRGVKDYYRQVRG